MSGASDDIELAELKALLDERLEELAEEVLGPPNPGTRRRREWLWGRKGSRKLVVRGPRRGAFYNHEAAAGGGPLELVMDAVGCDFAGAVRFAGDWLGLGGDPRRRAAADATRRKRERRRHADEAAEAADRDRRVRSARRLAAEAGPVAPTDVAWRYLVEARRIPEEAIEAGARAGVLRFHADRNALLVVATNDAGEVRAVQLVHLTAAGQKRPEEPGRPTKQTFGDLDGAAVRLPGDRPVLLFAEGPETGLSVWAATGRETWIALGGVANLQPPPGRRVAICADDDPRDKPAAKSLAKAVGRWRAEGRDIAVVFPWPHRRSDGSDFNDLIRRGGPAAVRARVEAALRPPPPPPDDALPVHLARHRLGLAIERFFQEARGFLSGDEALDPAAPVAHGIRVGVGLGKSDGARRGAAKMLAEMRAAGDRRTIVVAVPTHTLGAEQAERFVALPEARAAGLRAAVWRGREAADPDAPGERMCRDSDAVRAAQSVGVHVETAVCRDRRSGASCPFFGTCGYQRQKRATADLWIVPHEVLFTEKPAALGKPAAVVVDEAAWADGLEGAEGGPIDLALDALDGAVAVPNDPTGINTERLRHVHRLVRAALDAQPDGPLRRAAMLGAGIDASTGRDGRSLSWQRVVDPGLKPGMPAAERDALVRAAAGNRTTMRLARFFRALEALVEDGGPEASGWASLARADTDVGGVRVLRLRGRRDIRKGWRAPTLLLDALLDPALVRPYWPQAVLTAELESRAPHMRLRQLVGRDWPKTALVPDGYADAAENERRLRNSERLRAAVLREARATDGRALVVAQKAVVEYWRQCGPLPGNVELAWHNNVAGRDEWGPGAGREGVRKLIVIGRTLPRPADVERLAEALTGGAVTARASGRYERHDSAIRLRDGVAVAAEADRHPDPIAEAIRWQVCEGELIQIVGRGRGVNRTAENPLEVLVLTDRPLPLPVDEAVSWQSLAPSPADLMMSQGGVAFESAADAARAYPNLWATPEAAKKALQRGSGGHSPIGDSLMGNVPHCPLRRATYRRAGERLRPAGLVFDPVLVPDLPGWLEDRLGPLAWCDVEARPDPPRLPRLDPSPPPAAPKEVPWPGAPLSAAPALATSGAAAFQGSPARACRAVPDPAGRLRAALKRLGTAWPAWLQGGRSLGAGIKQRKAQARAPPSGPFRPKETNGP